MMGFYCFERCRKNSAWSIIFYGVMGLITLAYSSFLMESISYAILTGYIVLLGILCLLDFPGGRSGRKETGYLNLAAGILIIVLGVHMMVFSRFLSRMTPVFLGLLLIAENIAYAAAAMISQRIAMNLQQEERSVKCMMERNASLKDTAKMNGVPSAVFCTAAVFGGMLVLIFTLGFGAGGIAGLNRVTGASFLIACIGIIAFRRGCLSHGNENRQ